MRRRRLLAAVCALPTTALAGCAGVGADREEAARGAVEDVAEELEVVDWLVDENRFFLDYVSSGDPEFDVEVIGPAYAGGVDEGVNVDLEGAARDPDQDATAYLVNVRLEWALRFLDGELSEEEYLGRIANNVE